MAKIPYCVEAYEKQKKIEFAKNAVTVLGSGDRKVFADVIGVSLSAVNKWCSGHRSLPLTAEKLIKFHYYDMGLLFKKP